MRARHLPKSVDHASTTILAAPPGSGFESQRAACTAHILHIARTLRDSPSDPLYARMATFPPLHYVFFSALPEMMVSPLTGSPHVYAYTYSPCLFFGCVCYSRRALPEAARYPPKKPGPPRSHFFFCEIFTLRRSNRA